MTAEPFAAGNDSMLGVILEHRFDRTPDGAVWTLAAFARPFWARYLMSFEHVRVIARVRDVSHPEAGWRRVDGDGVSVAAVPHYLGPADFLRTVGAVRRAVHGALAGADAVVLRTPGTLANVAVRAIQRRGLPYQVEVVGDPHEVFSPGVVPHLGRALFRWWFVSSLRSQTRGATVAAYVTEHALQRRYPPGPDTYTVAYSDVELGPDAFVPQPPAARLGPPFLVVTVTSMDQPYKAIDVQLDALRRLRAAVGDVRLSIVGDGRLRPDYERLATDLGVAGAVTFFGALPGGAAVRAHLDAADLFWLPSRTEGLPRALVEAMARGLPALGSTVGGIPELLPAEALVPPDDAPALAAAAERLLCRPDERARHAETNLARAHDFAEARLAALRASAYAHLAAAAAP